MVQGRRSSTKSRNTSSSSAQWDEVGKTVKEGAEELAALTTHSELYEWAKEHKFATASMFPKFKTELNKRLDIDYDELRSIAQRQRLAQIEADAADRPMVEQWAAGDDEVSSYAVCGPEGLVAWYGEFYEEDEIRKEGDQNSADLSAAGKAVFLAGKVREELEVPALTVRIHVLNHHVRAEDLMRAALSAGVVVEIDVDEDTTALDWSREPGSKSWRETKLERLLAAEADPSEEWDSAEETDSRAGSDRE
ncbi:hypothetical protein R4P64_29645 [Rhodococcus sp. IEGM 1366]|uniref:hypothetical protein n=1 Tax=Rhodococcus sp. IEGM 1366 TaxID=3082223 RepID=UPI0029556CD0|nr:hypothetical protein [Rhodococcus sp. IEGM 1366]MDV8070700.1 hypothetical protein [Rhodococcus sp. IEGM 1366]